MSIIIAILIFGTIVIVHEIGHFIAARKCGILVEEFAIGMGPLLLSKKRGDTLYSIRLFPIGGFCKMLGDDGSSDDSRSYSNKKVYQRALVSVAGTLMNFLLAFLLFFIITLVNGASLPMVHTTEAGSPADQAGLLPGDLIIKLDNTRINLYEDLLFELENIRDSEARRGQPVKVTFLRSGAAYEKTITPYQNSSGDYKFGFLMEMKTGLFTKPIEGFSRLSIWDALAIGFYKILFYIKMIVHGLINLVTLKADFGAMAGPIGIVSTIGETYKATIAESIMATVLTMCNFAALLSANLGVFNLLPLPALDGGRLLFLLVEAVRRKPINPEKEGFVHFVGFVLLMILAVFVAVNDIIKII